MRHFLAPLVDAPAGAYALRNERTGVTISTALMPAFDSRARRRGLLGRHALERHTALVLAPCQAIHTWFMRFAIDVLFVRQDGTVLEVLPGVSPWRIALSGPSRNYGDAPRAPRRPPRKARGGTIPGVFDRRATPRGGMHRRPNAAVITRRAT